MDFCVFFHDQTTALGKRHPGRRRRRRHEEGRGNDSLVVLRFVVMSRLLITGFVWVAVSSAKSPTAEGFTHVLFCIRRCFRGWGISHGRLLWPVSFAFADLGILLCLSPLGRCGCELSRRRNRGLAKARQDAKRRRCMHGQTCTLCAADRPSALLPTCRPAALLPPSSTLHSPPPHRPATAKDHQEKIGRSLPQPLELKKHREGNNFLAR